MINHSAIQKIRGGWPPRFIRVGFAHVRRGIPSRFRSTSVSFPTILRALLERADSAFAPQPCRTVAALFP